MDSSSIADFFQQILTAKDQLTLPEDISRIRLGNLVDTSLKPSIHPKKKALYLTSTLKPLNKGVSNSMEIQREVY